MNFLDLLEGGATLGYTENGAVTHTTTGSHCLDLFSTIGGLRCASDESIIDRFIRAYSEDKDLAMKILFYARDIRGGLGERKIFRILIKWLAKRHPESLKNNLSLISEYGRFDDLLVLMNTPLENDALHIIKEQLDNDLLALENGQGVSLLAKWLPSVNASNKNTCKMGKKIARCLGMNDAEYRKVLSKLRAEIDIIENDLRLKQYDFDYSVQPSKAMLKYRNAFIRNDRDRYINYLRDVMNGNAKMNTSVIYPYELVERYINNRRAINEDEINSLNTMWAALPDYGGDDDALAIIDTSASMSCPGFEPLPAAVALSLGLYFAERNKGEFAGCFIEFSEKPELIRIKGKNFAEKMDYLLTFNDVANTNIEAVFDLILNTAVENSLPADKLPSKLVIISDMEFDWCVENSETTNFQNAKTKFESHGYRLPDVVFWNVASRNHNYPVSKNEQGVCLVSGSSPKIFSDVASGSILQLTPYDFMMDILTSERYSKIVG